MLVPSNPVSDDSDDDLDNGMVDPFTRKYQLISERCEVLQQDNERLVYRIQQVRKLLRKTKKERKFVLDRLDVHGDAWRNVPMTLPMEDASTSQSKVKIEKQTPPKGTSATKASGSEKSNRKATPASGQKRKKAEKTERDPNAPKRPANPFFQFCQEQRSLVIERLSKEMQGSDQQEPTKQEVTKQLANKWNTLSTEDKKIYLAKYHESKERYAAALLIYKRDNPSIDKPTPKTPAPT